MNADSMIARLKSSPGADIYRAARTRAKALSPSRPTPTPEDSALTASLLAPIGPADSTLPPGPRVVLLDDCRDQVNFGANILVDGMVRIISKSLPNAVIVPIPSHWLMDLTGGWEAFVNGGKGLRQPQARFPALADQFDAVADAWLAGDGGPGVADFLDRFDGADLVLLNGEGSIYRTNHSAITELFLAWFAKVRLGVPTMFVNGMIHLTDVVPVLPGMVRRTFGELDAVAVREPYSLRNLQQYAPEVAALMFPDSAFVITSDAARETPAVQAIRDRIGREPFFCFDPGAMPMDHSEPKASGLYELIRRLKTVTPVAVLVNSSPADGYIKQIAEETDSVYVDTISDYREYMALVRDAQFSVTGRYHNPMLAAIVGTPSITFASANHKVHGACELLEGLAGVPYDGTHVRPDLDAIEVQARACVQDRDLLRERLLDVCQRRRAEAYGLGDLVASIGQAEALTR